MRALRRIQLSVSSVFTWTNARALWACTATLLAGVPLACGTAPAPGGGAPAETVVLVTRHAERASDAANADLSEEGRSRAEALAATAERYGLAAVYTTDLCRTAQTGQPAALAADVPLQVLATGSGAAGLGACTPRITARTASAGGIDAAETAARILELHRGSAVLVVGHSNTVPALVEALTGRSLCPDPIPLDDRQRCFLPESAYGDLFVVHVPAAGAPRVERLRVGA